jgi:hypothetical protein
VDLRCGDEPADDPGTGGDWGHGRTVRAEVVAALLLGAQAGEAGYTPGVSLIGARVAGVLRARFAEVRVPLLLEQCFFEESPDLYWASLAFTSLRGSVLPGLRAGNAHIQGHLRLTRCSISGEVRLVGGTITGGLLLDGARIANRASVALNAERLRVGGDIRFRGGFSSAGEVLVFNSRVGGSMDLDDARLSAPGGLAMSIDNIEVQGGVYARRVHADGELSLRHATVHGAMTMRAARLHNPAGVTLRGTRLNVHGGMFLGDGFSSEGEIRLSHARIGRHLVLAHADLRNPAGNALAAEGATVEGTLDARGLRATGTTDLSDMRAAGPVHFEAADLACPGGTALAANGIQVGAVMNLCDGFTARGTVRLASARITSQLCFDGAALAAPGGQALRCWRTTTPELVLRLKPQTEGAVNLQHASVSILRDDPGSWPGSLRLDGLTYDVLDPHLPAARRLAWLSRDPGGYLPRPYEQLAVAYRNIGHDKDARTVLLAKQRRRRATLPWYARAWGRVQDAAVGYGYRPARAALWLVALLAIGTGVFAAHHPPPFAGAGEPAFNPFIYTLDILLPVIDFGQERAFSPHGIEQWIADTLIFAGLVLATAATAGIVRALRRD